MMRSSRVPIVWTLVMLLMAGVLVMFVLMDERVTAAKVQVAERDWNVVAATDDTTWVAELKLLAYRESRTTSDRLIYDAQMIKTVSGSALPVKVVVAVPTALSSASSLAHPGGSLLIPQTGATYEMHLGRQPALGENGYELFNLQDAVRQIDAGVRGPDGSSQSKYMPAMHAGTIIWLDDDQGYVYVAGGVSAEDARKVDSVNEALSLVDGPMGERDVAKYAIDEVVAMQLRFGQSVRIGETCLEQEDSYPPIRCAEQVVLLQSEPLPNKSGVPDKLKNKKMDIPTVQDAQEFEQLRQAGVRASGVYERRMLALSQGFSEEIRRLTEDEVRDLVMNLPMKGMIGVGEVQFAWPDFFLLRMNALHGAPDFAGGRGLTRYEYWFGESRESFAVVIAELGQIYIVKGEHAELIYGK
jgi:hypothetical protein